MLIGQCVKGRMYTVADTSKIRLLNGKSLSVCSFYRPPGSRLHVLSDLTDMIETVKTDCLVIGSDFNIPEINWGSECASSRATTALGKEMLTLCNSYSLSQLVLQPTRGNNVLDLSLTNQPSVVQSTLILPGISDHSCVLAEMNFQYVKLEHCGNRRIYSYRKARTLEITRALESYIDVFETLSESLSVD